MKPYPSKRELISLFMESPLYFDLLVRERLELLRDHERRSSLCQPLTGINTAVNSVPVQVAAGFPSEGIATPRHARIIVGYTPKKQNSCGY